MKKYPISKQFIADRYYNYDWSQDKIAKSLGISQWVISHRLREWGLKAKDKTRKLGLKTYFLNDNYFNHVNKENAWLLGWLVSDGFIREGGRFGLRVSLKDRDVLDKAKEFLGYTGKIIESQTFLKKTGKKYKILSLLITSHKIVNQLKKYGLRTNKTTREVFPLVIKQMRDREIIKSFIRGVFEGDGSILFDAKRRSLLFQIVGPKGLLLDIQNYLIKYLGLRKTKLTHNVKTSNHFALRYRGNKQALKIFDWLYLNSKYHLNRKYGAYLNLRMELS
jgi:hypothetical protein